MRPAIFLTLILSLFLLTPAPAAAVDIQPPSGWREEGPESHAEQFLDLMVEGRLDDAFKQLLGTSQTGSVDKLKFELYSEYKTNGKPLGYEQILKEYAGKTVLKLRYILLFKNMPKIFDIYYYNPDGQGWKLRTFSYKKDIKDIYGD